MEISEILEPACMMCDLEVTSKKRILEMIGEMVASHNPRVTGEEIFSSLLARERLGSTGLGHGVAIPHGRLKHLEKTIGAFVTTGVPVDFDSIDNIPVDVMFVLLVPEDATDEHLGILAKLAEMFSDDELLDKIRSRKSCSDIYELITSWSTRH